MSKSKYVDVLKKFTLSICVVTVGRGGVENGLTVSWVSPVSFEPLQFMISVDTKHYSTEFLDSTKNFAINLLKKDQKDLAAHFAQPSFTDREKLDSVLSSEAESGAAILTDALAFFDCEVVDRHKHGDHNIYVGQVIEAGILNDGEPLTTLDGMYYLK
jgi:flavin reductase (DIM6/NTAB) family NADH-FMN oxidoreductase RutF